MIFKRASERTSVSSGPALRAGTKGVSVGPAWSATVVGPLQPGPTFWSAGARTKMGARPIGQLYLEGYSSQLVWEEGRNRGKTKKKIEVGFSQPTFSISIFFSYQIQTKWKQSVCTLFFLKPFFFSELIYASLLDYSLLLSFHRNLIFLRFKDFGSVWFLRKSL